MPYTSFDNEVIIDTLTQINKAIVRIAEWNRNITSYDDYNYSPDGIKTLAATCMLLESIGEGISKIDKRTGGNLLSIVCPDIAWNDVIGMRNHIAHGYFEIDAEIVFDAVKNDIIPLQNAVERLIKHLNV